MAATGVPVPETAVHENGDSMLREDKIGFAGQGGMQTEAQAFPVKHAPHFEFRTGVTSADRRHHAASRFAIDHIDHRSSVQSLTAGTHEYRITGLDHLIAMPVEHS